MNELKSQAGTFQSRNAKSSAVMIGWIFLWTLTMILADKAELYQWYTQEWMTVAAITINFVCGLIMILFFVRYLKDLDEMQRKIQLDSLAFSMGIGLVGSFTYSLLVTTGYIKDPEISDIILLVVCTYMASVIFGQVRYR